MRLISRAGYFVFIKINMKTPKKKKVSILLVPGHIFPIPLKLALIRLTRMLAKECPNLGKSNVVFPSKFLII